MNCLKWTPSPPSLNMTWASLGGGWWWPGCHYDVTSLTSPLDCRGATTRCQLVSDWQWVAMWQYWQYWQSMARPDQVMRGSPGSGTSLYRPWAASAGSGQCPLSPHTVASTLSLSPGPGSLKYVTRGAMGLLSQSALSCSWLLMSPHPAHHGHGLSDDISQYVVCFPQAELCSPGWLASVLGGWVAEWLYNWNILSWNKIPRKETILFFEKLKWLMNSIWYLELWLLQTEILCRLFWQIGEAI